MRHTKYAFIGAPGAGKTAFSQAVAGSHVMSFANGVKEEVSLALAYDPDEPRFSVLANARDIYLRLRTDIPYKQELRPLLQWWGTEYRRAQDPDYWVTKLLVKLRRIGEEVSIAVDDCRFPNEYKALRAEGFVFVLLGSGPQVHPVPVGDAEGAHDSERHWPSFKFDYYHPYVEGLSESLHKFMQTQE